LRARWRSQPLCLTLIVTVILIDLGSTTFLQPYHFVNNPDALVMGQDLFDTLTANSSDLEAGTFAPTRNLHTSKPINSYLSLISRTPSALTVRRASSCRS
jgi:hypothetical protein